MRQDPADRFGPGKVHIEDWINRYNRRQAKLAAGILPGPKDVPERTERLSARKQNRHMRSAGISCCGIFCNLQEGSEAEAEVSRHISPQRRVSAVRPVCVLEVRSGCYAFVQRLGRPEKDAAPTECIARQRERSYRIYGCRRMRLWLRGQNIFRNSKTVLRIMKKYNLLSEIRRRRKWRQKRQKLRDTTMSASSQRQKRCRWYDASPADNLIFLSGGSFALSVQSGEVQSRQRGPLPKPTRRRQITRAAGAEAAGLTLPIPMQKENRGIPNGYLGGRDS